MIATIASDDVRTNSAIATYDTISRTYRVNTYKDGHICCRCEFHAYEGEEAVEPIISAHWVAVGTNGWWFVFGKDAVEKKVNPTCSHCGKSFDFVALQYKRCPECGAHMEKIDGDEY